MHKLTEQEHLSSSNQSVMHRQLVVCGEYHSMQETEATHCLYTVWISHVHMQVCAALASYIVLWTWRVCVRLTAK